MDRLRGAWVEAGVAAALVTLLAACGGGEKRETALNQATKADSAVPSETAGAKPTRVGEVGDLKHPESARYDPGLDVWFVSNINGDPSKKDNNGFISRIASTGKMDSLKFIEAGRKGVTLNGPKGLAIVADTLWVADIDAVRAFNKVTGAPIASISLAGKVKFLNDAAAGPDGVYFTDSGLKGDAKGQLNYVGPDQIIRVEGRKASVVLKTDSIGGANGITWMAPQRKFVINSFGNKNVFTWAPGDKSVTAIATGPGMADGLEVLPDGRILMSSWADSSLLVVENGKAVPVATGIPSPADFGLDPKRNRVGVPMLMEDKLEFWDLPSSSTANQ
jgi:sugar lactone lactonase YvrE